jgi:hypothetical protein
MKKKLTKREVLRNFKELWDCAVAIDKRLIGDSIAKREAFNDYVDALNKDGQVSDRQAFNWSNPF